MLMFRTKPCPCSKMPKNKSLTTAKFYNFPGVSTRKPVMEEMLLCIFQFVGEIVVQCVGCICAEVCEAFCLAGQRRIEKHKILKKQQELQAVQPKSTLLRPSVLPSETEQQQHQLLRPAAYAHITPPAEMLRAHADAEPS